MSGLADLCGSFEQLESRRLLDATLINGVITVTTQAGVADIVVIANDRLPSAMGAQLGSPGKIVIDIDGDASFLMTCSEMATIAEFDIPVKICILNNDFQGMVKQWQDLFYQRRYSNTPMKNPNFAKMADAYGIRGIRCENKCDVEKTVKEMLAHKGPVLVDFFVEPNEHVYPMVPSGKGLHEMEMGTLA